MHGLARQIGLLIGVPLCLSAGQLAVSVQADEQTKSWMTQQQNISCALIPQGLRCDVAKPSWKVWGCQDNGCIGSSFVLPNTGKAYLIRTSDTTWIETASVFSQRSITVIGAISCKATATQLNCANTSGGRFRLSNTAYSINR